MYPVIGITCALQKPHGIGPVPTSPVTNYFVSNDYSTALEEVGALPVIIPMVKNCPVMLKLLDKLDGLIVTGGGRPLPAATLRQPYLPGLREQDPQRYRFDSYLIEQVLRRGMPLVGICRGSQMLNEVKGGSIHSRIRTDLPGTMCHHQDGYAPWGEPWHSLRIDPGSKLASIIGTDSIEVNSLHHQSIRTVGRGLKAVAYAPDGVVEAIESTQHPFVFGLQFHPEKMKSKAFARNFFTEFHKAAVNYRQAREARIIKDKGGI